MSCKLSVKINNHLFKNRLRMLFLFIKEVGHFLTRYTFYVLVLNIENQKFYFLTEICGIQKKVKIKNRLLKNSLRIFFPFL